MEFLDILKGATNKFDSGFSIGSKENKAIRDAIVYILEKVKDLEKRLPPEVKEKIKDEVVETVKKKKK